MFTFLRMIWSRIFSTLSILILLLNPQGCLLAQSNFIPLERGDHIERKEHLTFSPGIEFSGNYRFRSSKVRSSSPIESRTETNSPEELSFDQDLRLHLRTILHRTISLNLEIATNQEPFYKSDIRKASSSSMNEEVSSPIPTIVVTHVKSPASGMINSSSQPKKSMIIPIIDRTVVYLIAIVLFLSIWWPYKEKK